MMLDHDQIRKARADLGISQAALAQATGINRTILSGFETGQLSLGDDCARRLTDFFSDRGLDLDDIASRRDERPSRISGARPRLIDNFVVAPGLSSATVEGLLTEFHSVEQQIDRLEQAKCQKGLLGIFTEECERERQEMLVLNARWRCLVLKLQGRRVPEPRSKNRRPINQAEWLGQEFSALLSENRRKSRQPNLR